MVSKYQPGAPRSLRRILRNRFSANRAASPADEKSGAVRRGEAKPGEIVHHPSREPLPIIAARRRSEGCTNLGTTYRASATIKIAGCDFDFLSPPLACQREDWFAFKPTSPIVGAVDFLLFRFSMPMSSSPARPGPHRPGPHRPGPHRPGPDPPIRRSTDPPIHRSAAAPGTQPAPPAPLDPPGSKSVAYVAASRVPTALDDSQPVPRPDAPNARIGVHPC